MINNTVSKKHSTTISPFMVGHCARQNAMYMLQYPAPKPEAQKLNVFAMGNDVHARHQEWMGKSGVLVAVELPLNRYSKNPITAERCADLRVSGRLDALVRLDKKLYVVELKSAKDTSFNRMVENGPYESYLDQITLYMYLTDIFSGIIYVENKNDQSVHEFMVDYDTERAAALLEKIRMINEHVLSLTLPPRPYKQVSFECRQLCDYKEWCWSNDPEWWIRENRDMLAEMLKVS